jgi:hypothetical protein
MNNYKKLDDIKLIKKHQNIIKLMFYSEDFFYVSFE